MPHDIYGEKIFDFVSEMANGCYGSNCSRNKPQLKKSESASQTTETKEKVQNFLGCKIPPPKIVKIVRVSSEGCLS